MKDRKQKKIFKFMEQRRVAIACSSVLIILALASLITEGLNLGIDFTGGTLVEVGFD